MGKAFSKPSTSTQHAKLSQVWINESQNIPAFIIAEYVKDDLLHKLRSFIALTRASSKVQLRSIEYGEVIAETSEDMFADFALHSLEPIMYGMLVGPDKDISKRPVIVALEWQLVSVLCLYGGVTYVSRLRIIYHTCEVGNLLLLCDEFD
jgi:hypothetical protein